jgi:Skp family chaperone for outer membrane proteins
MSDRSELFRKRLNELEAEKQDRNKELADIQAKLDAIDKINGLPAKVEIGNVLHEEKELITKRDEQSSKVKQINKDISILRYSLGLSSIDPRKVA